jgi:putative DNA primase/helicase
VIEAALLLAQNGLSVFGVAGDCRSPLVEKGRFEHGCHDATREPGEIRRRWEQVHPDANVSVATGDASGVLVVDVDIKNGVDGRKHLRYLQDRYGAWPLSWKSMTPSGGYHLWFRQPAGLDLVNRVGLPVTVDGKVIRLIGLDIRSTGASVAAPPSRKGEASYRWERSPDDTELQDAPAWLLKLCERPPLPPPGPPLKLESADRMARYAAAAINGELDEVAGCQPGGRNERLFISSAKIGSLVGAGLIPEDMATTALESAAAECGLLRDDGAHAVRTTILSGLRRGMAQPREIRA